MIVRFDSLDRFESPNFILCNPGCVISNGVLSNVVGGIPDTTDEELVLNFNSVSELNFRVPLILRDDDSENQYTKSMFMAIQNRRMIYLDGIGFFVITSIGNGYDGTSYKDVKAESCETEIQNKVVPYIENGTYNFNDLMSILLETLPMWSIGEVADTVSERYRTFEDVDIEMNTLAFMLENMQDAYECIFVFDTTNRVINVYDQNDYVVRTNIHVTRDDLINSIQVDENSEDLYTAISVLGDNNLSIAAVNPLGGNVVYNFDYYLDWMTPSLRSKVESWKVKISDVEDDYYDLNLEYYDLLEDRHNIESELSKIKTQIDMYKRCRDNIVAVNGTDEVDSYNEVIAASGGVEIEIHQEIEDTLAEIDNLIALAQDAYSDASDELVVIIDTINNDETLINSIHDEVSIENYFTSSEYGELYNYIYEGSYTDEYITVTDIMTYPEKFDQMKILYDRAKAQLVKVSSPTQEFSIDMENFIFIKDFSEWSSQLETGCLINCEVDNDDIAELFLSTITVNYYDKSLKLTFGNRFNRFDPRSIFNDTLGDIRKSANSLNYIKDILYPIKNGEFNEVKEALENSRTLSKNAALSSNNEDILIDDTGFTGRTKNGEGGFNPEQIKITGKSIVFTDDSWDTAKTAVGQFIIIDSNGNASTAYGINAEAIVGDMIMGNSLRILDNNGQELFTAIDGRIASNVSGLDGRITSLEQTSDSLEIRVGRVEEADPDHVTTTNYHYTFNDNGLNISRDGEEIKNQITNTGMYVFRNEDEVLVADADGVNAINLTARQYLIIGKNSRLEDYKISGDEKRTACFYIGG